MSGDTSPPDWKDFDYAGRTEHNLITDISETFNKLSSESRAKRRIEKLREELVREHIENRNRPSSFLESIAAKLFKRF
jgi:hypothetical protein